VKWDFILEYGDLRKEFQDELLAHIELQKFEC